VNLQQRLERGRQLLRGVNMFILTWMNSGFDYRIGSMTAMTNKYSFCTWCQGDRNLRNPDCPALCSSGWGWWGGLNGSWSQNKKTASFAALTHPVWKHYLILNLIVIINSFLVVILDLAPFLDQSSGLWVIPV
jgi:hypothetical protein